ncbi:DUF6498-containing protein [Halomicrobium salinisoli]|uniref:DUF6498-containing protein n=1 Tax=Halomicrobium salinisoli TaxID=2878391 RepID=UPI001CF06B6E|nr:DUF6498-containing protein [Halomicrobium salinisoli]
MNADALRQRPLPRAALIASNAVPLVGAAALDWSPAALVGLYVVEAWAVLFWTAAKVPFARKRQSHVVEGDHSGLFEPLRAKRGAVDLPGLPPLYVRNLPNLIGLVFLGVIEVGVSFAAFALTDPTITTAVAEVLLLGSLGVFLARGVEFWSDYVRGGRYRDVSPGELVAAPFGHLVGFAALIAAVQVLSLATDGTGASTAASLVLIVAGKTAYDCYGLWRDHARDGEPLLAGHVATAETAVEPEPVPVPDGEPEERLRPRRRAIAIEGVATGVRYLGTGGDGRLPIFLASLAALAAIVGGPVAAGAVLAVVGAFVAARAAVYAFRFGTLEYRLYPDAVVSYDRWLDAPQVAVRYDAVRDAAASPGVAGRVVDAATLELTAPDWAAGEATTIVGVADPDPILDRL